MYCSSHESGLHWCWLTCTALEKSVKQYQHFWSIWWATQQKDKTTVHVRRAHFKSTAAQPEEGVTQLFWCPRGRWMTRMSDSEHVSWICSHIRAPQGWKYTLKTCKNMTCGEEVGVLKVDSGVDSQWPQCKFSPVLPLSSEKKSSWKRCTTFLTPLLRNDKCPFVMTTPRENNQTVFWTCRQNTSENQEAIGSPESQTSRR